jgi:hypothetical protein
LRPPPWAVHASSSPGLSKPLRTSKSRNSTLNIASRPLSDLPQR